jgi:iron(III) transport system substrate-binding protein
MKLIGFIIICLVASACLAGGTALAQSKGTAGQILRRYNELSPGDRRKALIKGAQVEKELAVYSSMRVDELDQLIKTFNKHYPFLKLNIARLSGRRVVTRIETEHRAGRHTVDVAEGFANISYSLKTAGLIDPYHSPERKFFHGVSADKEGYFAPAYIAPVVLGYNTKMVRREEVPKSYDELLAPKWRGKLFLDEEDYDWYVVLMRHLGKAKGADFMRKLAANDIAIRRSRILQTQMIIAGERPIGIALHGHSLLDFKDRGAPIDHVVLAPYFAKPSEIMLGRYAPHPHAAALYLDWILSDEGQRLQSSFGRITARKGIKSQFPEDYLLAGAEEIGADLASAIKEFGNVFGVHK